MSYFHAAPPAANASSADGIPAWIKRLVGGTTKTIAAVLIVEVDDERADNLAKAKREASSGCLCLGAEVHRLDAQRFAAVWRPTQVRPSPDAIVAEAVTRLHAWFETETVRAWSTITQVSLANASDQLATITKSRGFPDATWREWCPAANCAPQIQQASAHHASDGQSLSFDATQLRPPTGCPDDERTWLADHIAGKALLQLASEHHAEWPGKLAQYYDGDGLAADGQGLAGVFTSIAKAIAAPVIVEVRHAGHLTECALELFDETARAAEGDANLCFELRGRLGATEAPRLQRLARRNLRLISTPRDDSSDGFQAAAEIACAPRLEPYVKALSIFGDDFSLGNAADLLSMTARQAADVITELKDIGLVHPVSDTPGLLQQRYRFSCNQLRQSAFGSLSPPARKRLHTGAALALKAELSGNNARTNPAKLAEIAEHLGQAGAQLDAARCWLKAGETRAAKMQFDSATEAFNRVIAITKDLSKHVSAQLLRDARLGLATCAFAVGRLGNPYVLDMISLVMSESDAPLLDQSKLRELRWQSFVVRRLQGRIKPAKRLAAAQKRSILDTPPEFATEDDVLSGTVETMTAWHGGTPQIMRRAAAWTISAGWHVQRAQEADGQSHTLTTRMLTTVHGHLGILETLCADRQAADIHVRCALEIAAKSGDPTLESEALVLAAQVALWSEDQPASTSYAIAAKAIAQRYHLAGRKAYAEVFALYGRACVDPSAAAKAVTRLVASEDLQHAPVVRGICHHVQARMLLECGRDRDALAAATKAERLVAGHRLRTYWPLLSCLRIKLAARQPDCDTERLSRQLNQALRTARSGDLRSVVAQLETVKSEAGL